MKLEKFIATIKQDAELAEKSQEKVAEYPMMK